VSSIELLTETNRCTKQEGGAVARWVFGLWRSFDNSLGREVDDRTSLKRSERTITTTPIFELLMRAGSIPTTYVSPATVGGVGGLGHHWLARR